MWSICIILTDSAKYSTILSTDNVIGENAKPRRRVATYGAPWKPHSKESSWALEDSYSKASKLRLPALVSTLDNIKYTDKQYLVEIKVKTDWFPEENRWELKNHSSSAA